MPSFTPGTPALNSLAVSRIAAGTVYLAVYHIDPNDPTHVSAFNAFSRYTLRIRKPS